MEGKCELIQVLNSKIKSCLCRMKKKNHLKERVVTDCKGFDSGGSFKDGVRDGDFYIVPVRHRVIYLSDRYQQLGQESADSLRWFLSKCPLGLGNRSVMGGGR